MDRSPEQKKRRGSKQDLVDQEEKDSFLIGRELESNKMDVWDDPTKDTNIGIRQVLSENEESYSSCPVCRKSLSQENNVLHNGRLIHRSCFDNVPSTCVVCKAKLDNTSLQVNGQYYCEKDYAEFQASSELPSSLVFEISSQPAPYQIANYNIHPPPALKVSHPLPTNVTIYANLLKYSTKTIISGGFQGGDVRVFRGGHSTIYFTSLKLSKMGPIKTEMQLKSSKQLHTDFCIQFKIGENTLQSEPFKLVSSCSQLPQEVRDIVRPSKKLSSPAPGNSEQRKNERTESDEEDVRVSPGAIAQMDQIFYLIGTIEEETKQARAELEAAIQQADMTEAGKAAQKLAWLQKLQQQANEEPS